MAEDRASRESRIREQIDRTVPVVRNSPLFQGQSDTQVRERVAQAVRSSEQKHPSLMNKD
jgi:hypothetical protein